MAMDFLQEVNDRAGNYNEKHIDRDYALLNGDWQGIGGIDEGLGHEEYLRFFAALELYIELALEHALEIEVNKQSVEKHAFKQEWAAYAVILRDAENDLAKRFEGKIDVQFDGTLKHLDLRTADMGDEDTLFERDYDDFGLAITLGNITVKGNIVYLVNEEGFTRPKAIFTVDGLGDNEEVLTAQHTAMEIDALRANAIKNGWAN